MSSTTAVSTSSTRHAPDSGVADRLVRLGRDGRLRTYQAGEMGRAERSNWAARFPEEVPLVNGEFEWIGLSLADLD